VVIFADDLGYGDLSVYGHPTIHTPNLDRMAYEGIKLTAFYASPACSPSRAALLTGRYALRAGVPQVLGPETPEGLPPGEVTLAEALKEENYRTAIVGKWHLGSSPGFLPTDQGFDAYYGLLYSNDMIPPWVQTTRPLRLHRDTEPVDEYPVDQTTLTRRYTEEAVRFIRESRDEPFFLYLAHAMPHLPISASGDFAGRSAGGRYGDVIEELDWSVGEVLAALEAEGLDENTLVVFTSDNGPWSNMPPRMSDTEPVEPWDAGTAGPLRGAKATNWEGGSRVPMIARWPGRIPPGQVSPALASTMDLFPTFLTLAGGSIPQDRPIDGKDIMPLLAGTGGSPHDYFYYLYPDRLVAVRDATWKLRVRRTDPDQPAVPELYNLSTDPYERFDVAAQHPEIVTRLREQMVALADETGAVMDDR
jgi:arylsulfatase A-like enzyme